MYPSFSIVHSIRTSVQRLIWISIYSFQYMHLQENDKLFNGSLGKLREPPVPVSSIWSRDCPGSLTCISVSTINPLACILGNKRKMATYLANSKLGIYHLRGCYESFEVGARYTIRPGRAIWHYIGRYVSMYQQSLAWKLVLSFIEFKYKRGYQSALTLTHHFPISIHGERPRRAGRLAFWSQNVNQTTVTNLTSSR